MRRGWLPTVVLWCLMVALFLVTVAAVGLAVEAAVKAIQENGVLPREWR